MNGSRTPNDVPLCSPNDSSPSLLGVSRESAVALCRANRVPARKVVRGRYLISTRRLLERIEQGSTKGSNIGFSPVKS